MNITEQMAHSKRKPILIGIFAVLAVLTIGTAIAFASGLTAPHIAYAFDPPCCTVPPVVVPVIPVIPIVPIVPVIPVVPVVTPPPACTLSATPDAFTAPGTATLHWTALNATTATIDNGVGDVSPISEGDKSIPVSDTTTYKMTVTGPGGAVTCNAKVTLTPPTPQEPACTLSANPTSFVESGAPTLSWTTQNATAFALNQGIGDVTSLGLASGSKLASTITATTTYIGTVTGANGVTKTCSATVGVTTSPPTNPAPVCSSFTATPTAIVPGATSTLAWVVQNATAVSLDNSIGDVSSHGVATGSYGVSPAATTNYTLTATGPGGSVSCPVTVTVTFHPAPSCTLAADPTSVSSGGTSALSWTTSNATSFSIDQGLGKAASTDVAGGSTTTPALTSDTTFTGTAVGPYGTATCTAPVTIHTTGCTSNCGGGHGGGGSSTRVSLEGTPIQPLSYVYLSQIPYTGLDLGPVGTVIYWLALILWSLALAYILLFKLVPYVKNRALALGKNVNDSGVDEEALAFEAPRAAMNQMSVATPVRKPLVAEDDTVTAWYSPNIDPIEVAPETLPTGTNATANDTSRGHSAYEGFRSFGERGALSIDDIVKGLSRTSENVSAPAPTPRPMKRADDVVPAPRPIPEPVTESYATMPETPAKQAPAAAPVAPEVPSFIASLIAGNREATFSALRAVIREGADAEAFLSQVVCALDDAYRARTERTAVHPEIARVTGSVSTSVLERLVTAFATAVDSSYSVGITGAKLALTRALAILGA